MQFYVVIPRLFWTFFPEVKSPRNPHYFEAPETPETEKTGSQIDIAKVLMDRS
jgi:hypothetical protein